MLKVFRVTSGDKKEIEPVNGIYDVIEVANYELILTSPVDPNSPIILEDEPLSPDDFFIKPYEIRTRRAKAFFQDFFGVANLSIGGSHYQFNVRIDKFKIDELEKLILFVWKNESNAFNLFFSKSRISADLSQKGFEYRKTSKFVELCEDFYKTFNKLQPFFQASKKTKIESRILESTISADWDKKIPSIEYFMENLDEIIVDSSLRNSDLSVQIDGRYCVPLKIGYEEKFNSFNVYENQIILGSFQYILKQIKVLQKQISRNVNIQNVDMDTNYTDFKYFKKIPFLYLNERLGKIEKNIHLQYLRYKRIFINAISLNEFPRLTPQFIEDFKYKNAYMKIVSIRKNRIDINSELEILNFRKLSQLYEIYNFHMLLQIFRTRLSSLGFEENINGYNREGLLNSVCFSKSSFKISVFYEIRYYNDESLQPSIVELTRLSGSKNDYYTPDFVIEIKNEDYRSYYILDAKYSKYEVASKTRFENCCYKYIADTGLRDKSNEKVKFVGVIHPSSINERKINSAVSFPRAGIIGSNPDFTTGLEEIVGEIINEELKLEERY